MLPSWSPGTDRFPLKRDLISSSSVNFCGEPGDTQVVNGNINACVVAQFARLPYLIKRPFAVIVKYYVYRVGAVRIWRIQSSLLDARLAIQGSPNLYEIGVPPCNIGLDKFILLFILASGVTQ